MTLDTRPAPRPVAAAPAPSLRQRRLPRRFGAYVVVVALTGAALLAGPLDQGLVVSAAAGWFGCVAGITVCSLLVEGRRKAADRLVTVLVSSAFAAAMYPLASIMWTVTANGIEAFSVEFFTYSMYNVVRAGGGIYHTLMGTLLITLAATVLSVPIGLLTAIYLVEYGAGSRLASWVTFLVDVMTGIPSIVAGLFAYALFVLFFGPGVRMGFAGAVALSVLMIPVVVRSCEEMLKLVPDELREASYALGVPRWRTIVKVVLPTALAGLVTGVTLAVARVVGETAPLLIVAGVTDSTNMNLFDGRMSTLPVFAYNSLMSPGYPPEPSIARAWGAALVLMLIVMLLFLIARAVSYFFSPEDRQ